MMQVCMQGRKTHKQERKGFGSPEARAKASHHHGLLSHTSLAFSSLKTTFLTGLAYR